MIEDNIIFRTKSETAAPDLIRENTHRPTGPEGMTEKEKVDHIRKK